MPTTAIGWIMILPSVFKQIEPTFPAGLLDDPLLLVRVRATGRSLLFDCGPLHHLAKRTIKSIDAIFISHAHMDHFMGMDAFVRHSMVSGRVYDIYGPPGMAARMERKLGGYDWNLAEDFWSDLRVHEIHPTHFARTLFSGSQGFRGTFLGREERRDALIYANGHLQVEAALFDHKIPVLGFRITEKPGFQIDPKELESLGLIPGHWLQELKKNYYEKKLSLPIRVNTREGEKKLSGEDLYGRIRRESPCTSIGYLTDIGATAANFKQAGELFADLSLLICECSYLRNHKDKARRSFHLCTDDARKLAEKLRPRFFLPMHLSKSHLKHPQDLYRELRLPTDVTLLQLPSYQTPRPRLCDEIEPPTSWRDQEEKESS
jgi:ribonuclease Z